MTTGYGEFAKNARQGALTPQQWNAYLMQRNQIRGAYKQAFNQLQSAAQQEGINIAPPELGNSVSQAEAQAKLQEYANTVNQNLSYFDVDVQLNTIYKNAAASGLNIPRPTTYGKTVKDAATAKVILDNYTKRISQFALQKNLTDAVNDIKTQAAQQGVTLQGLSPNAYVGLTEARAQYFVDNYLKNANNQIAVKSYNDAVNSISAQAKAQGVSVTAPSATAINSANVQSMIDQYAASVNSALLQKSVSGAVDSIYTQAKAQGVEVAKPSLNSVTQANAQATIDNYLTKVNKVIESRAVAAPTASPVKNVNKVNTPTKVAAAPTTSPVNTSAAPSYIVYDDIGREQTITQSQLQQLQKAQQSKNWNENYQVIPQEVANARANWWINNQGLYEWVPVTAADKKKLADRNAYYSRFGQSPKTTLTLGASPSEEYSKEWYRTGGNHNKAPVGSGDKKIAEMKAKSSVNNNASVKTSNAKPVVTSTSAYLQKIRPGEIKLADGTWIKQIEKVGGNTGTGTIKVYSSMEALNKERINIRKEAAEARKAYEAIRNAYIPVKDQNGRVIDAIQIKGLTSTGEGAAAVETRQVLKDKKGNITGIKIVASSGSAREIKNELDTAKRIAKVAITDGISAVDQKAVLSAREKIASRMQTGEKISYLSELKNADIAANRRLKTFTAAQSKYFTVDQKAFDKELKNIEKETKGMTEAQRKKYLLERAKNTLPATGRSSDLWTKLNSDIFTGKVDKGFVTGGSVKYAKAGSADVMDNISRKQVSGEPLTATEVSLLTAINGGYKPSTTVSQFVKDINSVTGKVKNKVVGVTKTRTVDDYSIKNQKAEKYFVQVVNALQEAAKNTPEMVGGFIGGTVQAGEYTGKEIIKGVKSGSFAGAKQSASNIALSAGLVVSQMGRGSAKQFKENPGEFVATLALTSAVMGAGGKAVKTPVKYGAKQVAIKTGITRTKALGSEIIPYKEPGIILDQMRAGKQVEGMHATNFKAGKNKKVFVNEPGTSAYKEPGTFGHLGRFSTVSNGITEPFGEFFLYGKGKPTYFGKTVQKASANIKKVTEKVVKPVKVRDMSDGTLKRIGTDIVNPITKQTYRVTKTTVENLKAVKTAKAAAATVPGKAVVWTANLFKKNFVKNYNNWAFRSARRGERAVYKVTGDPVKLSNAQWERVFTKFKREGNFWTEYERIQKIAQRQADKSGKPVATPSPKAAIGDLEAESEIWWVFPKKGVKITSSQKIGVTEKGVDIVEVRYGNQAPVVKKSISQRLKENREYNKQVFKALDGKKYNLNHLKSYASDANRRLGELYGKKTTRPRAFEGGEHGKVHTEQVGKNVASQAAKGAEGVEYWLGVMHDVTKIGKHETAGIPHAVAAAEVIKRGMITDTRFNNFWNSLSKAKQTEFVKAIGEHTTIKPINRHLVTEFSKPRLADLKKPFEGLKDRAETLKDGIKTSVKDRPSEMSKALANADRMDLTRFGLKPQKRKMFKLKGEKQPKKSTQPDKIKTVKSSSVKSKNIGVKRSVNGAQKIRSASSIGSETQVVASGEKSQTMTKARLIEHMKKRRYSERKTTTQRSGVPVELTDTQWNKIFAKIKADGNFWTEYANIESIAQRQADKIGKRVKIPTEATAKGIKGHEFEVKLITPKNLQNKNSNVLLERFIDAKMPKVQASTNIRTGSKKSLTEKRILQQRALVRDKHLFSSSFQNMRNKWAMSPKTRKQDIANLNAADAFILRKMGLITDATRLERMLNKAKNDTKFWGDVKATPLEKVKAVKELELAVKQQKAVNRLSNFVNVEKRAKSMTRKAIEKKIQGNKGIKEPVKQTKEQYYTEKTTSIKPKLRTYATLASQRGIGTTYAEYTKGVKNTYTVLKAYQKGNYQKGNSGSYENLKTPYKKQPKSQSYRSIEAEYKQRKGANYEKPKGYEYKQKAGSYKPAAGYEVKPYNGNYKIKADYSAYTAKGKYKASGYGGNYGGSGGGYGGSYPGVGSGYGGGYVKPPNQKTIVKSKGRQADSRKAVKSVKDLAKFTRKIQNQFGNLDTMFGSSKAKPIKKTIKKSVKRVQRA